MGRASPRRDRQMRSLPRDGTIVPPQGMHRRGDGLSKSLPHAFIDCVGAEIGRPENAAIGLAVIIVKSQFRGGRGDEDGRGVVTCSHEYDS